MATLSVKNPTLLDLSTRTDPDGSIAAVVEVLNETNEILDEMTWIEGNLVTGHKSSIRTGIPTPTWRKLYGGVQPTKSTTVQVTDNTGMLEAYSEVDKALADLNSNTAEFRLSEDRPHIEGMNQEIADTLFFGNETTEPEAFTGFGPRFNDNSGPANADNIITGGGSGSDNASIWLIGWSPETVHGIVPKGSTAGIQVSDKGQVTIEDADGSNGRMEAYRTHYRWDCGLTVRDWRYVVRICNIDKSDLTRVYTSGAFSAGANLPDLMFQALRLIPSLGMVRPCFYMSRDIATWVARQTSAMGQGGLVSLDQVAADKRFTERFHGIPMRRVDVLAADEATVS
jgi:hypothetical protein|tara:strand:- start:6016 stop:7038 length:1023 start_codon:yes stop_codon:yes gene_type:complete